MLIQLELDLRDKPAHELAAAADQVGHYLAEMIGRGHTGTIRMIDLTAIADDTDEDETTFSTWYGKGFQAGYENGLRIGRELPTHTPRLQTVDAEHPDTHTDIPPHMTAQDPPPRELPTIATWTPSDQTTTLPTAPEQEPPADAGPHTMEQFLARQQQIREAEAAGAPAVAGPSISTNTWQPDGQRPDTGDGAPVSAFDHLELEFAHEEFSFPKYPEDGRTWHDREGAQWAYDGTSRTWDRRTYPAKWPTPADPGLLTHPDGGRPTP